MTNRGVEQRDIVLDDRDRRTFVRMLAEAVARYRWCVHAFVLMARWSSDRTTAGLAKGPAWLMAAAILDRFDPGDSNAARTLDREFVPLAPEALQKIAGGKRSAATGSRGDQTPPRRGRKSGLAEPSGLLSPLRGWILVAILDPVAALRLPPATF